MPVLPSNGQVPTSRVVVDGLLGALSTGRVSEIALPTLSPGYAPFLLSGVSALESQGHASASVHAGGSFLVEGAILVVCLRRSSRSDAQVMDEVGSLSQVPAAQGSKSDGVWNMTMMCLASEGWRPSV